MEKKEWYDVLHAADRHVRALDTMGLDVGLLKNLIRVAWEMETQLAAYRLLDLDATMQKLREAANG